MSEVLQETPMLRQYLDVKKRYRDCLVFFRMGDFYEMFFEDAEVASRVLNITLTSRGELGGKKVPMAGVPYHAAKGYLHKLIAQGYKVAICEQLEDPRFAKGIVKRDVIRVVTPGSAIDEEVLNESRNIYTASICASTQGIGLAWVDLSTGEFRATELGSREELAEELSRISPEEVLLGGDVEGWLREGLKDLHVEELDPLEFQPSVAEEALKDQFKVGSISGLGLNHLKCALRAAGALIRYLYTTQKTQLKHITEIRVYNLSHYMILDPVALRDLELLRNIRRGDEEDTLLSVLDRCQTPMGKRLLRQWLVRPLLDIASLEERLDAISCLVGNGVLRKRLREELKSFPDLERINGRISMARAGPRDLVALKEGLLRIPAIRKILSEGQLRGLLEKAYQALDPVHELADLINRAIVDSPPALPKELGIIKEGFHEGLDHLIKVMREGKDWISRFALEEQERTGIPNLRVGYNRVFGYYIEVTKSYLHLVPQDYYRKQTLSGAERFINQRLKEKEEEVITAEERRLELEAQLFLRVREEAARFNDRIINTAAALAQIDLLVGMAELASESRYVRPTLMEEPCIEIKEGRHPVLERKQGLEQFIPNDIALNDTDHQILLITGPNMAGKSTILRQTALISIMAQIGSFVPATSAKIGLIDRIFTRIGASDDIARGQSTFMVEMAETSNILRNATPRSLLILDEVGRGTSTYDGMSIAWAVVEAIHSAGGKGIRTLFATHYHELTELGSFLPRVKNYTMDVKEWKDSIVFLRRLRPGGADRSYGIEVARIAGIPDSVLKRAKEVLRELESGRTKSGKRLLLEGIRASGQKRRVRLPLFPTEDQRLTNWIKSIDIDRLSPLDALLELKKMKDYVLGKTPSSKPGSSSNEV